eukprot:GILJ01000322.1.p1 GENE.GILJ01000322.1~~GILJ01000322.1.p1  ORF type:complete len:234 (-),score=50.34 GILJ01000322.1:150-851(-)
MNDDEAQKQIHQMVNFILEEAKEKANEIEAKTLQEFNIEKLKMVQHAKDKLKAEYQRKTKQVEVERRIARSTMINKARLQKMEAREQAMQQTLTEARQRIASRVSADQAAYKALVKDLLVQGLLKLLENKITVQCRQQDASIVRDIMPEAKAKFSKIIFDETGVKFDTELTIDTAWLPAGPTAGSAAASCLGGVLLKAHNNKITLNNTLDARLNLCYDEQKPEIRSMMFPLLK